MSAMIDLTGQSFGHLAVIRRDGSNGRLRARWLCRCACGEEKTFDGYTLRRGAATSCGCSSVERCREMARKRITHGKTKSPEFVTWTGMISRCTNPKDYRFKRYGARGITVCDRWLESFENFLADMGPRPFRGAELDRKENDGHYEPNNCRWVTSKVNNNNRSSNRVIEFAGQRKTLTEWSRHTGIHWSTIRARLEAGWTVERAMTEPVRGSFVPVTKPANITQEQAEAAVKGYLDKQKAAA